MKRFNEHSSLDEILKALENKEERSHLMKELKELDASAEEVKGFQMYLRENGYSYESLKRFLNEDRISFNQLILKDKKRSSLPVWVKYAAVIVLPILGVSYFLMNGSKNNLFDKYYEKEVGLPVLMGNDTKITFNNAMNAFKDDSYEEAIDGFNRLLELKPSNDTLHYFLGCAYFEHGNVTKAEENYKSIGDRSAFSQKRDYRLALLYIKNGELELSAKILEKIVKDPNHRYYQVAEQLLAEPYFDK